MKSSLERGWVAMLDSPAWRRLAATPPMKSALRSRPVQRANLMRRRFLSGHVAAADERSSSVETFCLVVGHTKSGGSMLGAMLDAHPEIVMGDELGILDYVAEGFDADRLTALIVKSARREAMKGRVTARRLEPYSFAIPDQWQGTFDTIRVVGDTKAGIATQRLGADPGLVNSLAEAFPGVEMKYVQVVRHPLDPIAVMTIRGGRTFTAAVDRYFANCEILQALHERLGSEAMHVVRYEDLVAHPREVLGAVCTHLGVQCDAAYLDACAGIVRPSAVRERDRVTWPQGAIEAVGSRAAQYPFLADYRFEG